MADMRIRFSGEDFRKLEELAALRGEHPRLTIKLIIGECLEDHRRRVKELDELDYELPF
ncbi:MAG: hypothetical protein NXH97_12545 [Rhodobacteraceae bacterium]|nr:hypothetical protein [Paracoccaceae bacterium]